MNVAFLGTPGFALPTLEAVACSRHRLVVICAQPDRPAGRGRATATPPVADWARAHGIPLLQPEDVNAAAAQRALLEHRPEVGVVAAYGQILSDPTLAVLPHGMINLHASLLPRWRGAAPAAWAILSGDARTGVTVQRIVRRLDAGPVLASRETPIDPEEDTGGLLARLAELGGPLVIEVLDALERGEATAMPQDEGLATRAPRLTKAQGRIDWTRPSRVLDRHIRALRPWPVAWTGLAGRRILVQTARPTPDPVVPDRPPGEILSAAPRPPDLPETALPVATGEGTLWLLRVQPAGKREMPAGDFVRGLRLPAGARFTDAEGLVKE